MLRDRLVCGCRDQRLQCRLLEEADFTFTKAFKIAKVMETAEKETKDLHEIPAAAVHATGGSMANKRSSRKPPTQQQQPRRANSTDCYHCGGKHKASECKFRDAECNFYKKKGHIAKVCRSRLKLQKSHTHQLHTTDERDHKLQEYSLFHTPGSRCSPLILISLKVNGVNLTMELDTGATLSLISEKTYHNMFPAESAPQLKASQAQLKTYTGESIKIIGAIDVEVVYNDQHKQLNLLVVEGEGPSLLGRDWLSQIKLDWSRLNHVQTTSKSACQEILDKHQLLFKNELGTVKGTTTKIHVDPKIKPRFFKARPVPYALRHR